VASNVENLVYISGESEPVKMFDRTANLNGNQIINYMGDPTEKRLMLVGIAPGAPEVRFLYLHGVVLGKLVM
jgi:hypothetical protein